MKNRQSSSVLHDGFIYGLDEGILACVDASTGELKWKGGRYGHGQLLLAGDHLVVITEDGELVLVAPTPEKLQELARVPAHRGRNLERPRPSQTASCSSATRRRWRRSTSVPARTNRERCQSPSPTRKRCQAVQILSLPGIAPTPVVLFDTTKFRCHPSDGCAGARREWRDPGP